MKVFKFFIVATTLGLLVQAKDISNDEKIDFEDKIHQKDDRQRIFEINSNQWDQISEFVWFENHR